MIRIHRAYSRFEFSETPTTTATKAATTQPKKASTQLCLIPNANSNKMKLNLRKESISLDKLLKQGSNAITVN